MALSLKLNLSDPSLNTDRPLTPAINLRQRPGYGSCKHPNSHNTESCWTVFSLYSTKLNTVIVCNDLTDCCMEHDLGLVDHHGYLGLGKRESGTSTKWSALDSPPSLGSHDWHHLAIYPYWIFVLWNRCYEEKCCFPADLNIQLLLQSLWVYSSSDVHTLHVLSRQTLLSLVSCALSQFSPNTASKGWLALPITIILLLTTASQSGCLYIQQSFSLHYTG